MFALKFEVRANANNTNIFVEQETLLDIPSNDKGAVDKACMIGMGSFATPKEMLITSEAIMSKLKFTRAEHKFEEITHGTLNRGSYRVLAKKI